MTLPLWLSNLIAYSLQIAILAAAGTLLVYLFRLRIPRVTLLYWQILLLACLSLPLMQRWEHPVFSTTVSGDMSVMAGPAISGTAIPMDPLSPRRIPWEGFGLVLAAGIMGRLAWLVIGFFRLRSFQNNSHMFLEPHAAVRDMQWCTGVRASLLLSGEIDSPVTFGFRPPTIILPLSFTELSEPSQQAVLCHELLHVRRYDWVFIMLEEIARALFWFHPAIWWLLSRIQLSREQTVDHEVVRLIGNRDPYLNSLLEFARSRGRPRMIPAPLFLKERHLVQRVALLIKEVSMSRSRLVVSVMGISILLMGTVYLAAGWFPLTGAPVPAQEQSNDPEVKAPQREPIRVGGNVAESKLIRRVAPIYPESALRARVQGHVVLTATINEEGFVYEATVVQGHPILAQAALDAVKQWQYRPTLLNGMPVPVIATVTVIFRLKDIDNMPTQMDEPRNLVDAGGPRTTVEVVAQPSEAPGPMPGQYANSEVRAPQKPSLRVGGDIQESKLIYQVNPIYPEEAKRLRLEGTVRLEVTINEEGLVSGLIAMPGNYEILEEAAIAAVKQWRYRPTLLNGEPVPVTAPATVVYQLRDSNDVSVTMDGTGRLGQDLSRLQQARGSVDIRIDPNTPFWVVQKAVREILQAGVRVTRLSQPFVLYEGQVFYTGKPVGYSPNQSDYQKLIGRIISIARASGQLEKGKPYRIGYRIYQNEAGEVVGLQHLAGPRIPEIEDELMRTQYPAALVGSDPVPFMSPFYIYSIG